MGVVPGLFTTQAGYMIAPAMITNPEVGRPIGTGPFVFDHHTQGQVWSFKKNPTYRRAGLPHLDDIDFLPVPDPATRTDMLRAKELDLIQTQDGQQILDLRAAGTYKLAESTHGDKSFLILNTSKPPFDNLTARKAVAYATDAAKWRHDVYADVAGPANSPYGPGQPGCTETNGFPSFDLPKARETVAAYRAETGRDLSFTILALDDPTNLKVVQTFADGYKAAGIDVTIEARPQINLVAAVAAGGYELSQFRVFGQPNPDADVHFYRSTSINPVSLNFPRYANPAVDQAVAEALASTDAKVRDEAYRKVNEIYADQVPMVWLGQEVWIVAANPEVNGVYGAGNGSVATIGPKTWVTDLSVTR